MADAPPVVDAPALPATPPARPWAVPLESNRSDLNASGTNDNFPRVRLRVDRPARVIDLRPDLAPNHVGYVMKLASDGAYNGTIFHRVVKLGIVAANRRFSSLRA